MSDTRANVSWGDSRAADVQARRLADTAANRQALQAEAAKDKLPSALVDLGNDVVLLSGANLVTDSPVAKPGGSPIKTGDSLAIDGVQGTVLSSDDGLTEIDASKVIVAVLDTGIDLKHPAFKDRIVKPYNAVSGSQNVTDHVGHGTHVAGIVAGARGLQEGASGVAHNAKLMPIAVFSKDGKAHPTAVARGIRHAVDNGAKVITMSLGGSEELYKGLGMAHELPELKQAIAYARSKGVVIVASSGNEGTDRIDDYFPVSYPGVLAVGAVNSSHKRANFSNGGDRLDLTAPGYNVMSAWPGGGYRASSGTSMAAPYVAGAAALVMAQHPDWSADQVIEHLKRAVDDRGVAGKDISYGNGETNLFKAAFGRDLPAIPAAKDPKAGARGILSRWFAQLNLW